MTLRELLELAARHPRWLAAIFAAPPAFTWLLGGLLPRGRAERAPWNRIYAVLVYLACVPGVFALVLVAYVLFFTGDNLLDVDLLVYGLPVASMVATLALIARQVPFEKLPGFDRLVGLGMTLALSFAAALALQRMRLWVIFGASVWMLLALAALTFLLLRIGLAKAFRR